MILTCANLPAGSTFDLSKIIYSDGEPTPATRRLIGNYTLVGAPGSDQGTYWINSNEVTICLAVEDFGQIQILTGYAGPGGAGSSTLSDKVSAEAGWNVKGGTLSAGAVSGLEVTFEP